jgi:hypothetical protein
MTMDLSKYLFPSNKTFLIFNELYCRNAKIKDQNIATRWKGEGGYQL